MPESTPPRRLSDAMLHPLRVFGRVRDVAATMGIEFAVIGATFLAMRLAAQHWGPAGFGEFVLFRRNIGLLQLPLSISMALGLARYVALGRAGGRSERAYGVAATLIVLVTLSVAAVVFLVLRRPMAFLLFGSADYVTLLGGLLAAVTGAVLHGVAYGIFRGQLDIRRANVIQLLNAGVLPLAVLSWPGLSVVEATYWIGGLWSALAAAQLVMALQRGTGIVSWPVVRSAARELLSYGLPRIPGEFALSALFTIPVSTYARRAGIAAAGQLGFGASLVTLIATAFSPLGVFIVTSVATRMSQRDVGSLRRDVFRLLSFCVLGAVVGLILLEFATPWVVVYGLGREFAPAVPLIRFVLLAALPYVCYVVLRAVLDAASPWPYNARNLLLGLALFGVLAAIWPAASVVPPALLAAVLLVGVLSVVDAWRVIGALREDPRA